MIKKITLIDLDKIFNNELLNILKEKFQIDYFCQNPIKKIDKNSLIIYIQTKKNIYDIFNENNFIKIKPNIIFYIDPEKLFQLENYIIYPTNFKLNDLKYLINIIHQFYHKKIDEQIKNLNLEIEEIQNENKSFHRELTFASELQKNLLPQKYPFSDKIQYVVKYLPSTYIGGDFFNIVQINENLCGIVIIDVSGHGIKSAMIASLIKALFDKYFEKNLSPVEIYKNVNIEFQKNIHTDDFFSAFLCLIDLKNNKIIYSNASHPFPIYIKNTGEISELNTNGFLLGVFNNVNFEQKEIYFEKGDRIIFYTDGIIETVNENEEPFGRGRLIEIVEKYSCNTLDDIADSILNELLFFSKSPIFEDDITMLLIEFI